MARGFCALIFTWSVLGSSFAEAQPYLRCSVLRNPHQTAQQINFDFEEFADTMLIAKEVNLDASTKLIMTAAYIPAFEGKSAAGFVGIEVEGSGNAILAQSRHNLDISIRDVFFMVKDLASVNCSPIR